MSELPETTRAKINDLVTSDRVVVFMKGVRRSPQCGFSASVVELLDGWLDDYATVDVLADPELREGIKAFSDWPTIPQIYVDGEFVGGADIVRELEDSGELAATLGASAPTVPEVTITAKAAAQFKAAIEGSDVDDSDVLRLTIDGRFHNDLSIGARKDGDIEVESNGIHLVLDARSARRAKGLVIDFVSAADEAGFKIENPNAPPAVQELSVKELAARMQAGAVRLYDVRSEEERAIAKIEGTVLLDADVADQIAELPRDTPLYFHCHHGMRSLAAGQHFVGMGFTEVYNVRGGIDAWSQEVDPAVARY
ncbi:putative monothiol glutaredoxin ycf64-like protein [Enhygromyxa salina]|uniref:Putative monothiol glutaredoxin ycf64-like protein n=1 Tax=Enhygromyxa salina TaxID=215803 RepID=A0A0C1Z3A7_9BACT|nr:Grx4 family monothiol glutaredoxin [Enhygromyxa salina]KIG12089.1 putative monothiol glutaredoxin ycf64-like protein [Enhygromyxa salina]